MAENSNYTLETEGEGVALLYKGEFIKYFNNNLYFYQNLLDAEKYVEQQEKEKQKNVAI